MKINEEETFQSLTYEDQICFIRNIFSENAFTLKKFGATNFHALIKHVNEDVRILPNEGSCF